VSSSQQSAQSRIIIIDAEKFALSPIEKNFDITWIGNLSYANLHIDFEESFGYGLTDAYLNDTKLEKKSPSSLDADVRFLLKQGGNKLTIDFAALQFLGQALGQTIITAYIDYYGASVLKFASVTQFFRTLGQDVSKNTSTVLVIIIGGAVALGALAFIFSRLPSASNLKIPDISKSISSSTKKAQSKLGHMIMTLRDS